MSNRINKINQLLLKELAQLIHQEFPGKFITVIAVETTLDIKNAKVWVSVLSQDEETILKELEEKKGSFQSYLGKKLFIKTIPKISFSIDKSPERVAKIEELLKKT